MCSISGIFFRESVTTKENIENFFEKGELRGTDAFGIYRINRSYDNKITYNKYIPIPEDKRYYSSIYNLDVDNTSNVLIANHRAAPETECKSSNDDTVQPICIKDNEGNNLIIAHNGSVSNFIIDELKEEGFKFHTDIDSEAIIHAYLKFGRCMKSAMEYLTGGFAFLLYDEKKDFLYSVCTHNPLYCGYMKGFGLVFHSVKDAITELFSSIAGTSRDITENTQNLWEDYYIHQVDSNSIMEIDLDSGMVRNHKFEPRYIHPNFDIYKKENKNRNSVLVSASGGLDSSTTLSVLKEAELNPIAVHFKYGHRGQDAEELAINKITEILDIPLYKFDLEKTMKILDNDSMLTDPNHEITTGTNPALKTTAAWTCFRNAFFVTHMGALAENLIVHDKFDELYITGGFLQLTESGSYPDNSERFIESFCKMAEFGSICGKRIKPMFGLCNILKTEQFYLLNEFADIEKITPWLVSCDRPIVEEEDGELVPKNCAKLNPKTNNIEPACGSGRLSYWAWNSTILNRSLNKRRYYLVDDKNYNPYNTEIKNPDELEKIDIKKIISKLFIPEYNKNILYRKLK
jgi:7-cyano-7-deazaguanine synthase in queuosine biosynthesis/predicted glutamine amidotransferase